MVAQTRADLRVRAPRRVIREGRVKHRFKACPRADLGLRQDRPRRLRARLWRNRGSEILSTGGTAKALYAAGVPVREVSDFTGAPEILDGRVKTLHPRVHGGHPRPRRPPSTASEMRQARHRADRSGRREPVPVRRDGRAPARRSTRSIENIDIGGPSMVRSAAKNHERVAVVVDPADYARVLAELDAPTARSRRAPRFELARKAFAHTAAYDGAIAAYLGRGRRAPRRAAAPTSRETLHARVRDAGARAALRREPAPEGGVLRDGDAAGRAVAGARARCCRARSCRTTTSSTSTRRCALCAEFARAGGGVVKHNNPCGVADRRRRRRRRPTGARARPIRCRRSAASSRSTARSTTSSARELAETFLECVIAPGYSPEALRRCWRPRRTCALRRRATAPGRRRRGALAWSTCARVAGGLLVQTRDARRSVGRASAQGRHQARADRGRAAPISTSPGASPSTSSRTRSCFAARRAHARRSAPARCPASTRCGSRSPRRARRSTGAVLASDAFFPFRDGVDAAAEAGVDRGHPAGRLGARRRGASPPPTSTASRWCSPASATSGTDRFWQASPAGRRDGSD